MMMNAVSSVKKLGIAMVAISACLVLCMALPTRAEAANLQAAPAEQALTVQAGTVHKVKTAAQWHKIGAYNGGTFKVMANIKLTKMSQYLAIAKDGKYTIDLNGHTVKTTYGGKAIKKRFAPLEVSKGTVVIKDSSKGKKGVLRGTEACTILVEKNAKLYLKSGTVNNDFLDTQNTASSAIVANDSAKCVLKGGSVLGKIHGVSAIGNARVYTTGAGTKTYPYVRGEIGCGLVIGSSSAKLSLKGGSFGTKASPDYYGIATSGWYPVLDKYGSTLKQATGIKFKDAGGKAVNITTTLMGASKRLATSDQANNGYYTVYVTK